MSEFRIDALLPQEMATRVEFLGVRKAEMLFLKMFMLSVFTRHKMIGIALANGKVTAGALLRNWGIVYFGKFLGSIGTAILILYTSVHIPGELNWDCGA